MKKLVITEKPSVAQQFARAIGKFDRHDGYLENDEYVITWCVGHLVTMSYPEVYDPKLKNWDLDTLPFLPDKYRYEVIANVKKQFQIVKALLNRKDIGVIYNAGDSGREGEYIQRLVYEMAGHNANAEMKRVWIDSQTDEAIRNGIRDAKDASYYDSLSDSAYMRAIEDYSIGINFSRLLSCKYGKAFNKKIKSTKYKPISVGRVMTCVLGMIVDRERQIRNFKATPFYGLEANCGFICKWKAVEGTKFFESPLLYNDSGFKERKHAEKLEQIFNNKKLLRIQEVNKKTEKKKAPLLYNLAELQNECAQRFKISPDKTLEVAQKLYESKLTTYPRTDARVISTPVAKEIVKNIKGLQGYHKAECVEHVLNNQLYKGIEKTVYCDDSKITDHYAIIPTGLVNEEGLSELEVNIFHMIIERFISIFYPPAEYDKVEVVAMHPSKEKFFASEKILKAPGYLEVVGYKNDATQSTLSEIKVGDMLNSTFVIKEGQTTAPKRYNTGNLILAMENAGNLIEDEELRAQIKGCGIGTSATRAEIIKKLQKIGYIAVNQKTQIVTPHPDGEAVYDIVKENIPAMLSPEMTANWEKGLGQIADKEITKEKYLEILYAYINKTVSSLKGKVVQGENEGNSSVQSEHCITGNCPICGGKLVPTSFGYGCSNYRETGCWFSLNEYILTNVQEEQLQKLLTCGKTDVIDTFVSKKGSKYSAYVVVDKEAKKVAIKMPEREAEISNYTCPACHAKSKLFRYERSLECGCGFKLYTNVCQKELSDTEIEGLLEGKSVNVKGMTSKKGKKFNAILKMDMSTGSTEMSFEK